MFIDVHCLDMLPLCDRQTDRRTDCNAIPRTWYDWD